MAEAAYSAHAVPEARYNVVFDYRNEQTEVANLALYMLPGEDTSLLAQALFKSMGSKADPLFFKIREVTQLETGDEAIPHYFVTIQKQGKSDDRQIGKLTTAMRRYSSTSTSPSPPIPE